MTAFAPEYLWTMAGLDPLAYLMPKARDAEKKVRLIELADSILAARMRRVSLADIATGIGQLEERPISVSPDYLSEVMAECHGETWTKAEVTARRTGKSKGRKKTKMRKRVAGNAGARYPSEPKVEDEGQAKAPAAVRVPVQEEVHAAQRNAGRKT